MDARTDQLLRAVNRDFYDRHAASFSRTRDHPWPGWERVAARIPDRDFALLDAGCGNGRFGRFLADRGRSRIRYTGVDASARLVEDARSRLEAWSTAAVRVVAGDLEDEALAPGPFDGIVVFGVLHHVPGFASRVALLAGLAARLAPGGFLAVTLWRFADDARARAHTAPFAAHGLDVDTAQLEPGDRLLEWGATPGAVRYVHFVDDEEVLRLLAAARERGLALADRFRSDGRGGDLNEYLVWERA